jgi:hypothetical protein
MPIKTGQCTSCHAVNSFTAIICLDCKERLPWADSVEELQKKLDQATNAAQSAASQKSQTQLLPNQGKPNAPQRTGTPTAPLNPVPGAQNSAPDLTVPINVYETYLGSFIGKFSAGFFDVDRKSAMFIGLVCGLVYSICFMLGVYLIRQQIAGLIQGMFGFGFPATAATPAPPTTLTFEGGAKLLIIAVTPFVSIALSSALVNKLFSEEDVDIGSNIFIAGVSLIPVGLLFLISGLVGISNSEVIAVLSIFALSYFILMIYNGCTIINRVRDTAAAIAVPVMLLLSGWFTKIVLAKILGI